MHSRQMVRRGLSGSIYSTPSMAKGGGNNDKAIKLQQQSMRQSDRQAKAMEKILGQQAAAAEAQVVPAYEAPAPAPTQTTADLDAVAMDYRKRTMRRQGLNNTVFAGAK